MTSYFQYGGHDVTAAASGWQTLLHNALGGLAGVCSS